MIEKGKISAQQMAIMMYPVIVGTGIISVPAVSAEYAKNDLWISPLWAALIGFVAVYIAFQLHKFYPGQTIMQYTEHIMGRTLGKILGFLYLVFYIQMNGGGIRIYAEFVTGVLLTKTPIIVVISTIVLVCAFAVRGGVEVVARVAQFFFPLYVLSMVVIIVLLFPDLNYKNIFPILADGLIPSMRGAIVPGGWFAEFILVSVLFPYLTNVEKGRKWGMISVFSVMMTFMVTNLLILFVFGETTSRYLYPLFTASRYISIADFLQKLDPVIMAMWVAGSFIKFSVVFYALVICTAQWLNLSNYRPIVFPLGFLTILFSIWGVPSKMVESEYNFIVFPVYSFFVQILIPLLLLSIAFFRRRRPALR
ncbi:GerAB/ArcD/ProY family transporter [Neobacillus kokaensis]|uniref:Germination protein n=1 Tax=Neobacillus kokaensis TaxID=2759023 RepID=A0ABQ3N466_9BACI|nr:endospore germination permease [Neobacillus kokaensis]GHH99429.1 germination protein [Neobacillus kokaensis]